MLIPADIGPQTVCASTVPRIWGFARPPNFDFVVNLKDLELREGGEARVQQQF